MRVGMFAQRNHIHWNCAITQSYCSTTLHTICSLAACKGPFPNNWASKMAYFIFGYFSTKLGTPADGHEKIIT
jgi:hypothetical protein